MKVYNKLVRDRIPEIIAKNDGIPKTRILGNEEYLSELNKKLAEEVKEYLESGDTEELADIEEVIRAILKAKKVSCTKFNEIRTQKAEKRGGFKNKIFLESVRDKNN